MGSEYIINGTEEVVDAFTANSGIIVPVGQTINNEGSYAGTPLVTSITAGSGISVTNPASPGAATVVNAGVLSVAGSNGITPTTATEGAVLLSLSAVPNSVLAGNLVSSITAGAGISVTNPTGVGAATVAVASNVSFLPAQAAVTTTSLTLVSTGQGLLFTPSQTGNLVILVSAFGNNGTLADGIEVGAGYTAGTALVALGTAMGAAANGYTEAIAAVAGDNSNLSFTSYISGLTLGTEYAIQPTFASITGGTSTLTITSMVIMEIL